MEFKPQLLVPSLIAIALSGCGGGGDSGSSVQSSAVSTSSVALATAEGVYEATMPGAPYPALEGIILENGDVWGIYGNNLGSVFYVAGFIQGNGASSNGSSYNSTNAKDFGFAPAVSGTLSATFNATAKTISGTTNFSSITRQFSGAAPVPSTYSYNSAASLSSITGRWSMTALTGEGLTVTISATGSYTLLSTLGCTATGTITPRPSGKNVFNIAGTFGPAPCALPNQAYTGIAISYPLATGQTQFIGAAVDNARTYGTAMVGIK